MKRHIVIIKDRHLTVTLVRERRERSASRLVVYSYDFADFISGRVDDLDLSAGRARRLWTGPRERIEDHSPDDWPDVVAKIPAHNEADGVGDNRRGRDTAAAAGGRMIARSAYVPLRYSRAQSAGNVAGMALTYLAPVAKSLSGDGWARHRGLIAFAFHPTLRYDRLSPLWGIALPAIALIYFLFTIDSALRHRRGRGGLWKGRAQAGLDAAQ